MQYELSTTGGLRVVKMSLRCPHVKTSVRKTLQGTNWWGEGEEEADKGWEEFKMILLEGWCPKAGPEG